MDIWEVSQIIFSLLFVIGIIYLIAYLMRNRILDQKDGRYIKVIERVYLSQKSSLALLNIRDKIILISISNNRVVKLENWDKEEFGLIIEKENKSFKEYIQGFINTNWRDNDEK